MQLCNTYDTAKEKIHPYYHRGGAGVGKTQVAKALYESVIRYCNITTR